MSFGLPTWHQCEEEAVVNLTVKVSEEKKKKTLPSCSICWKECIDAEDIKVIHAEPITKETPESVSFLPECKWKVQDGYMNHATYCRNSSSKHHGQPCSKRCEDAEPRMK